MATKYDTMTDREVYLEFVNDFLTIDKMAEYYGVLPFELRERLERGKNPSPLPASVGEPEYFELTQGGKTIRVFDREGSCMTDYEADTEGGKDETFFDFCIRKFDHEYTTASVGELDWKYSPHFKDDAQGHIFSYCKDRLVFNIVGAAATTQKQLNKDCEELVKRYNAYPELLREHERMVKHDQQLQEQNRVLAEALQKVMKCIKGTSDLTKLGDMIYDIRYYIQSALNSLTK